MPDPAGPKRRPKPRATAADSSSASYSKHSVSVDRGLAILECFSGRSGSEGIAEISASVRLPRSSVHRYLQTLLALGLVEQRGTPRRRYRLTANAAGPGIAAIASTGIPLVAHDELVALRRDTGCTARLAVSTELDALLVDQAASLAQDQRLIAADLRPGARLPGQTSAIGQALLANLDLESLPPGLRKQCRAAQLELRSVQESGYAIEEHDEALCAVAVPVRSDTGQAIAAIDLIGRPPAVTRDLLSSHIGTLNACAERLAPILADLPWAQWRPYAPRRR